MVLIFYVFALLCALLVLGNLAVRLLGRKKAQLAVNIIAMGLIGIVLGYTGVAYGNFTEFHLVSINPYGLFFSILFTASMLLVNILAFEYSRNYGDFSVLASFVLIGMFTVSLSNSLISIFIGLELASIPTVFVILLSKKSLEASAKFFIMSSIAIAMLSLAIVLVYGGTNSLSIMQHGKNSIMMFASVLFIIALGFETSMFPFNVLVPDVYQGSDAYVTGMLGGVNKKLGFAALIQVLILVFVGYGSAFLVVAALCILTMFYGNIVALKQTNLKRMMAYSSISQAGYILIGIATRSQLGITGSLFQIFAHAFIFIGLLGIIAWLEKNNRSSIDDLIGLNGENRFAAFAMALLMLSLVGLPLTTGFVGKFLLFLSAINSGLLVLAILGIINSVISIYYYARPILAAYTGKQNERKLEMELGLQVVLIACIFATLFFGVYPNALINIISHASAYLFGII